MAKDCDKNGVPGLAIKTAALNVSYIFKGTFNACLSEGIFPAQWKIQRLIMLFKANKPPDEPSSYRPLCMLDIAGKLFERIISVRLEAAIQQVGGLLITNLALGRVDQRSMPSVG